MHQDYYEGTLQLRHPTKEMFSFIHGFLERENVRVSKEERVKEGVDLYLTSQKALQKLGKELQRTFGGQILTTRKLFTQSRLTSKFVYRLTVLFIPRCVKKGQLIMFKGEQYKVVLAGSTVRMKNVKTGKSITAQYAQLS